MLVWNQLKGSLTGLVEEHADYGYSGYGEGRNNPAMETVPAIGPIPRGQYNIGKAMTHPHLGPFAIPLKPRFDCKRSGFFIHGDSAIHPGEASHGCIILPRSVRQTIISQRHKLLEVI